MPEHESTEGLLQSLHDWLLHNNAHHVNIGLTICWESISCVSLNVKHLLLKCKDLLLFFVSMIVHKKVFIFSQLVEQKEHSADFLGSLWTSGNCDENNQKYEMSMCSKEPSYNISVSHMTSFQGISDHLQEVKGRPSPGAIFHTCSPTVLPVSGVDPTCALVDVVNVINFAIKVSGFLPTLR